MEAKASVDVSKESQNLAASMRILGVTSEGKLVLPCEVLPQHSSSKVLSALERLKKETEKCSLLPSQTEASKMGNSSTGVLGGEFNNLASLEAKFTVQSRKQLLNSLELLVLKRGDSVALALHNLSQSELTVGGSEPLLGLSSHVTAV